MEKKRIIKFGVKKNLRLVIFFGLVGVRIQHADRIVEIVEFCWPVKFRVQLGGTASYWKKGRAT